VLDTLFNNQILALFLVITAGLLLGRVRFLGLTLGSSGVIFSALAFGHLGYDIPDGAGTMGLVIFVYVVGLRAGPTFFRSFKGQGGSLAKMAAALIFAGAATTYLLATNLDIPVDLAAGIFAGALTSTPGLAAAMERLPSGSQVAVGYGIAYPFGVIGIVLFVQLLPRLLRVDLIELGKKLQQQDDPGRRIVRVLVEVMNPAVIGRRLEDLDFIGNSNCQVSRHLVGTRLAPVPSDFVLEKGQYVLVIGREFRVPNVVSLLGKKAEDVDYRIDTESERQQIVASSDKVVGKTLAELRPIHRFGVTVTRISRYNLVFVPDMVDEVEYGDTLSVVGEPEKIQEFAAYAGHRERTAYETDLISFGVGIIAGILLGLVSFDLGGKGFALGMSGGPLFVALILGHFGKIGPVRGRMPQASQLLLMEFGLVFFLAAAGVNAGHTLVPVLERYGLALGLAAATIVLTPAAVGYLLGRFVFKMNLLQIIGGVCGGMTSTPGLGVISSKTDSDIPVVSYAAAYPVALILMTAFAQILVTSLR